ncbi:hypothetical protein DU504_17315 [Haloplanus salinus]|jgi:hypothetical protein|uniref:KaiC-like domain-containing protein n=1 Tax=Haloplanus salinus TaxID=1126245 RepID=A0A368N4K8_9EURY|nr:hypothetical protein [Haloplanus salinus]RCU44491.1 hypothetical protein DU504_17315 [Haloplanus salinus]
MSQPPATKEDGKRQAGVLSAYEPVSDRVKRDGGTVGGGELAFDLYRRSIDQLFELVTLRESQPGSDAGILNTAIDAQQAQITRLEASATEAERYPGELFSSLLGNTGSPILGAMPEAVGMEPADIVLFRGKSTERKFESFRQLFGDVAEEGVVVSTKHVAEDIVGSVEASPLTLIDCTSSDHSSTPDGAEIRHVHGGNLTQLGTELLTVLDSEGQSGDRLVGLYSLDQLGSSKSDGVRDRFLNVLTGKLRSRGVGALVAVGSLAEDEDDWSRHFDYTITHRQGPRGADEVRVSGKCGTEECWRPVQLE